jgi:hypothetical protein
MVQCVAWVCRDLEELLKVAAGLFQNHPDVFQGLFLPVVSHRFAGAAPTDGSVCNRALDHFHGRRHDANIAGDEDGPVVNGGLGEQVGLESLVRRDDLLWGHDGEWEMWSLGD